MKQKALITGGAGFIGSHLSEFLLRKGWEVHVLDNLTTGRKENIAHLIDFAEFHFQEGDILDYEILFSLVNQADVVFHLAASVGVRKILENPLESIEVNILGTHNVLRTALSGHKKVLLASTSEVYGKSGDIPLKETGDSVFGPTEKSRWSYGVSKAIDEFLVLAYWKERDLPVIAVRFFNTVGPKQTGRYGMVVPRFVDQALKGEPITVYGDGKQTRSFTDVEDAISALYGLACHPDAVGRVFNIGGGVEISIENLALKLKELTKSPSPVVYIPYEKAYEEGFEDMRRRVPDISKIENLTGFRPSLSLEQTLIKIIEYHRKKLLTTVV